MKRVDWAFHVLDKLQSRGRGETAGEMGLGVGGQRAAQHLDREVVGWSKPKRRIFKRINKPDKMPIHYPQRSSTKKSNLAPKPKVPKPRFEKAQAPQYPGTMKKAPYRLLSRRSVQQAYQEGESSAMGAMRATGVKGTMLAGDASGVHSTDTGALIVDSVGLCREADLAGEFNDGTGLPEKLTSASGASSSENVEDLGCGFPSPVMVLSTIPESHDLGDAPLPPVKRSIHLSNGSESADEVGFDNSMPEKQSKQLQVFQRRESPSAKVTKSWVAERIAWNSELEVVVPGKNLNFSLDSEEQTDCVGVELGAHEELGC
jgi:hypothetical protein